MTIKNVIDLGNNIVKLREEEYPQIEVSLEFMKSVNKAQHASSTDEAVETACQIVEDIDNWYRTMNVFGYDKPDKQFLLEVREQVFAWVGETCK